MWGASFADLAKAAQEASEMATKKAQEASQVRTSIASIGYCLSLALSISLSLLAVPCHTMRQSPYRTHALHFLPRFLIIASVLNNPHHRSRLGLQIIGCGTGIISFQS